MAISPHPHASCPIGGIDRLSYRGQSCFKDIRVPELVKFADEECSCARWYRKNLPELIKRDYGYRS